MIRTLLELPVKPGRTEELVEYFRTGEILETAVSIAGCRSSEILVDPEGRGDRVVVIAEWDDRAAYDRWLTHPDRSIHADGLADLLDEAVDATGGAIWHVVHSVPPR